MKRKYKNLKRALFIVLVAAFGFSGCKKILDVNQNPNNPDHADPTLLLPTTQAAISQVVGNSFQVFGNMWAQYWTQSPVASQYKSIDQYAPVATNFDNPWLNLYRVALVNADLITKSHEAGLENVKGIAYLMKAYSYQLATDAFGDVPLSQALQPSVYQNPKYDAQQLVYDSIFMYIKKALPLLNANAVSPGTQDMIFQGDMTKWVAFANTLELRAYLRLSNIDPNTAKAGIAALYQTNPTFLTEDASITYTSTGGNENPFYNEAASPTLGKIQNVVASSTAVNAFTQNNDPRLAKFYSLFIDKVNPVDSLVSIPQGSYLSYVNKKVSTPSPLVGGKADDPTSATAPVKLLSAAESYFLQAEAVARGWAAGNAASLYTQGIQASFDATGAGDATTYIATAPDGLQALTAAATVNAKVKAIITQKYYAMCGFQGFEAWTEWRRTGYPKLNPSAATTIAAGQMPLRMLYPNTELTSNLNYPGTIPIYTHVWWGLQNP
ncbi:SusD/RagB family nutrient-binding outer membrane lipoprotein [Mucilaginibacter sp. BT774]|uniref:SusD/RagB family nutrient-binding outer membrane lipoprotein n=1 Tax=Mucilaginibacter sp. BT774 TaxID=3062276 RepID=UPI0026749CC2|nr:SusD/RagB family nutrient-binding outer membrane lipoprotein [Mucilaginibacter sp. BT774]MDO3628616.1 SusD/RagB family nutrient-binding outer membrane lipoprotein [Mucilaginibacter sp. BT774]